MCFAVLAGFVMALDVLLEQIKLIFMLFGLNFLRSFLAKIKAFGSGVNLVASIRGDVIARWPFMLKCGVISVAKC